MNGKLYQMYEDLIHNQAIDDEMVCLESHAGGDLGGNLFYIARELLNGSYGNIKINIILKESIKIPDNVGLLMSQYSHNVRIVFKDSEEYIKAIALSKYLFTDVQFSNYYIKREGQICVQTWHGTPLKRIGFEFVDDIAFTGAQKKSFIDADIILYPNEYTMRHMQRSYRLNNFCKTNILVDGYPRNTVFFDLQLRERVRSIENIVDKKVYAYMPTWRGSLLGVKGGDEQIKLIKRMDEVLDDKSVLYVKFHRQMKDSIDFSKYAKIRPFPSAWETYEFLSATDCLITDYSSVMFDYLCTRRRILLYTYDKQKYLRRQGTYIPIETLPFPQVDDLDALVEILDEPKEYDDTLCYEEFCAHDDFWATRRLCKKVISFDSEGPSKNTGLTQDNILLYGGDLVGDAHTAQFVDFVDSIDKVKYNVCVCYKNVDFMKNPIRLQVFTEEIDLMSIDYYKGDIMYDSNNCRKCNGEQENESWYNAFQMQFHKIEFKRIICFVKSYDDVLKMMTSSPYNVTVIINEDLISEDDYKKIVQLGSTRRFSIRKSLINYAL